MRFSFFRKGHKPKLDPEETFLDSTNLSDFDMSRFEGRMEKTISPKAVIAVFGLFAVVVIAFLGRSLFLQIVSGDELRERSERNRLRHTILFAERGIVTDRNGQELAWNEITEGSEYAKRVYTDTPGFSQILGFVKYPTKDAHGFYYRDDYEGTAGVEALYDESLRGIRGVRIIETDALGMVQSSSTLNMPENGDTFALTIDAKVQAELAKEIAAIAEESKFQGGAGVILDIHTGDIIAMTSYPEYDSNVLAAGEDVAKIRNYTTNERGYFLLRPVSGLYTPGSTVKPIMALAALNEEVISPTKKILSTGSISIPNPYDVSNPSIFRDWRANGWVDARGALANSSNIYFYAIGGGFEDQQGIGIAKIEEYARAFGLGSKSGIAFPGEAEGTVPNPTWKEKVFDGDPWRLGDTYNTVIGQYGFQATPLQMARAIGAVAAKGTLVTPRISFEEPAHVSKVPIDIADEAYEVVQAGMRDAVTIGTMTAVNFEDFHIAAKTGTAQVGRRNEFLNSWTVGFFPYENPRYAFAIVMERAAAGTLRGSVGVANIFFNSLRTIAPEYTK